MPSVSITDNRPLAKLLVKQDIIPDRAVRWAFVLAPCLVVGPALVIFSVIPFGPAGEGEGAINWFITDVNVGLLFVLAMLSIGIYGIILSGWSSKRQQAAPSAQHDLSPRF